MFYMDLYQDNEEIVFYACITLRYRKNWNTQLMSMIIFYVFLAAESDSDIHFAPSGLDFAAHEVTIFRKQ